MIVHSVTASKWRGMAPPQMRLALGRLLLLLLLLTRESKEAGYIELLSKQ
jgi:hypothetical protein